VPTATPAGPADSDLVDEQVWAALCRAALAAHVENGPAYYAAILLLKELDEPARWLELKRYVYWVLWRVVSGRIRGKPTVESTQAAIDYLYPRIVKVVDVKGGLGRVDVAGTIRMVVLNRAPASSYRWTAFTLIGLAAIGAQIKDPAELERIRPELAAWLAKRRDTPTPGAIINDQDQTEPKA
jgi:hypothetical protein